MGGWEAWMAGLEWWEVATLFSLALLLGLVAYRSVRRRRNGPGDRVDGALRQRLEAIEGAVEAFVVVGAGDRLVYANRAAARLFGVSDSRQLHGRSWKPLLPAAEVRRLEREALPALRDSGDWTGEVKVSGGDGTEVPVELSMTAMADGAVAWVARDGRWRDRMADGLARREERYRTLIETAGSVIVLLGADGRVEEWNREAERLFGTSRDQALGRDFLQMVPGEARQVLSAELGAVRGAEHPVRVFETALETDEERTVLWSVTPLVREDGGWVAPSAGADGSAEGAPAVEPEALVAVGQDVTGRRRAEEALRRQESLYRLLANNSSDLVALHDLEGALLYVSPSCGTLLGVEPEELVGKDLYQLAHSDDWKKIQTSLTTARAGRLHRMTLRLCTATGEHVWFEMHIRPIRGEDGAVVQLQSSSRDITERKAFEEQLEYQALHEPLTGLPNRTLFMDRLSQALARVRREGGMVGIMFMDLDRFKVINDSLGHAVGDRLLAAVAKRLKSCLREADTVARLGGDEFGVLLEFDIDEAEVGPVADRLLRQLQPPFTFAGTEVVVTGSIGIAFGTSETSTPEDLLRYADVAMFRAKEEGAGNWRIFDPSLDAGATRRLERETAFRRALEREELTVYHQPIVSLDTGRIAGVEALVRWLHPERGLVGPDEFIPLAEETGLIVPMGFWVMRQACLQAVEWAAGSAAAGSPAAGPTPVRVSVNLSARQFEVPTLEEEVARILEETGLEPSMLQLEITESEVLQSGGRIQALKDMGLRIAIDDFGTGYSSLGYLRNLPVDGLKIDRSFIDGLDRNRQDTAIVHTVITLADSLGLEVTAEGVETEEQLARLRELGCGFGQGYYFSRPISKAEIGDVLASDPRW